MEHRKRHIIVWTLLSPLVRLWARLKFSFVPVPAEVEGPYLVLSNHATSFDPVLVALSFKKQMYFVSSEHVFRHGFWSKLLIWAVDPISRLKGASGADAVMTVMRRLRAGANVCIFAEGSCTWDGVTAGFLPATGKLARACGATLVTYRVEGGYFTRPRWAKGNSRKGEMTGHVVGVYGKDELRRMSADEVNALIARDIHEDAYARQREHPVAYKSKTGAEQLEAVLCLCPKCGGLDTMRSSGNDYVCSCGYRVHYNERCFFEGDGVVFDNITDWVAWQRTKLRELAAGASDIVCANGSIKVAEILPGHINSPLGTGDFILRRDGFELCGLRFSMSDVTGISLRSTDFINLSVAGRNFELGSDDIWCAWKYMILFDELSGHAIRTN